MASEASSDALRLGASDSGGGNGGYGAPPPQPPGLGLAGLLLGAAALLAVLLPVVLGFAVAGVFALRWALSLPPGLPPGGRAGVPLHLDYLQSPPAGAACFLPPGLLLNGAVAPGAPPSSRALPPGASFDVVLTLELPDSPSNAAAGLFVVSTSVVTAAGEEVARAQRTAGLAYRSPGARLARAAARAPLLAAGLAGESQTVVLTPFEAFPDQRGRPLACVRVSVSGVAAFSPGGAPPQVARLRASLRPRLGPVRGALLRWPLTSGAAVAATFAAGFVAAVAATLLGLALGAAAATTAAGAPVGGGAGGGGAAAAAASGAEGWAAGGGDGGGGGGGGDGGDGGGGDDGDGDSDDAAGWGGDAGGVRRRRGAG